MNFRRESPAFAREVRAALVEDRAWQDVTSRAFIGPRLRARATISAKQGGVVAGAFAAAGAFRIRDRACRVRVRRTDGQSVRAGQAILEVVGPMRSILAAERTAVNVLTHLSGVATVTRAFVRRAGPGPKILDTRKTLPGLRRMEKWAVVCGGGFSHRPHLASAVLIKENHLASIRTERDQRALYKKVRAFHRRGKLVEMECQDRRDIIWGLYAGADILLLDNVPLGRLAHTVTWIREFARARGVGWPLLEVSGGVTLQTVRRIARCGVDRISVGRLTHSAPSLDMSLDVVVL